MNDAPLLVAKELVVGRTAPLLERVSLQLGPGECWFLLGPNGAGKTTLIATLLGLLPPLGGEVTRAPSIADRSGLGFVPQEQQFQVSLPLTVTEFVALGLQQHMTAAERGARTAAALQRMHIDILARRDVRALSMGQRRRALVARALARQPRLMVLDEPTANLDPHSAMTLGRDLEALRADDGLCLLHASHDLDLARRFATHVALVVGSTLHTGVAAAMFEAPLLARTLQGQEA